VNSIFAALFVLMYEFDYIKNDERWEEMLEVRKFADRIMKVPTIMEAKVPNYRENFDNFLKNFNAALFEKSKIKS
jgi:hypothetical protein